MGLLAEPAGLPQVLPQSLYGDLFGTIAARRIIDLDRCHLRAFLALHLYGRPNTAFDRPAAPEITIVDAASASATPGSAVR